jgi:hypothetical protein
MDDAARGTRDLRRLVVLSSAAFAVLLTALAWALLRLRGSAFLSPFDAGDPLRQAGLGLAIGAVAGGLCLSVVWRTRRFAALRRLATSAVEGIEPRWHDIVLVSVSAGWGEELFFRGALQPLAGVWLTSAAFVLLHGVLRHRSGGGIAFAVFLYAASLGLGALAARAGLVAAMSAHAAYDLTVLAGLTAAAQRGATTALRRRPIAGVDRIPPGTGP